MEEKITIRAARKKSLKSLSSLLGELGFSKIVLSKDRLSVERITGEDLKGKPNLDYKAIFLDDSIEFIYGIPPKVSKRTRQLELLPLFLDILALCEDFYDIKISMVFSQIQELFADMRKVVGKDAIELSAELEDLRSRYDSLNSRYKDLVGSSEANARILLECERRRDELMNLVNKLRAMSDERLQEEIYIWLKMHNGNIDLHEFGSAHDLAPSRVEEGLDMLIKQGFIKRRIE
jgi:hypothetical protein